MSACAITPSIPAVYSCSHAKLFPFTPNVVPPFVYICAAPCQRRLLSSLSQLVASFAEDVSSLAELKGPLAHLIRGEALPVTATPDFSVEVIRL